MMASTQSISTAIESIDSKKENLRKVFEDLQSQSSFLSSFTLQWKDLEEHFDSIKKSIDERFKELESKEKSSINVSKSLKSQPLLPCKDEPKEISVFPNESIDPRPEIKSFCIKMDGIGLRSYISNHRKELPLIREEILVALKLASDPAKLVLDSMLGFFPPNSKGDKDSELAGKRRTCILLLERLMDISPEIKPQVKEGALKVAIEWKEKLNNGDENPLEPLGFLQLLASYGLASSFDANDLIEIAVSVSKRKQSIDLCRLLLSPEKIPDLIRKLTEKGKQLDAVKFAYAFELVEMFPPVPLLKAYKTQSKKIANDVRAKGNNSLQSQKEATAKQISALKGIVKCIEEYKLESEYPKQSLDTHIEQLEKQLSSKKKTQSGPSTAPNQPQQQQQHSGSKRSVPTPVANQQRSGNKRPRGPVLARTPPSNTRSGLLQTPQVEYHHRVGQAEIYPQSSLLLPGPDRVSPYLGGTSSGHYGGFSASVHDTTIPQYLNSSSVAGPYGSGVRSLNYDLTRSPTRSQIYSFEHHVASGGLYDRPMAEGIGGRVLSSTHHLHPTSAGIGGHILPSSHHHHLPTSAGIGGHVLPPSNHPSYYP